jgi:hypothetical protein
MIPRRVLVEMGEESGYSDLFLRRRDRPKGRKKDSEKDMEKDREGMEQREQGDRGVFGVSDGLEREEDFGSEKYEEKRRKKDKKLTTIRMENKERRRYQTATPPHLTPPYHTLSCMHASMHSFDKETGKKEKEIRLFSL